MAEILAGGLAIALHELGVDARQTYKMGHEPYYEIWDINKKNLKVLEEAEEWGDTWGWWRYAKGSNLGTPASFFTVNGQFMIGWDGRSRDAIREDWNHMLDNEKAAYHNSFSEYEEEMKPREYENLLSYMCNEIGASTESNIIALAVDLARANGKTVAQLFKTYEG